MVAPRTSRRCSSCWSPPIRPRGIPPDSRAVACPRSPRQLARLGRISAPTDSGDDAAGRLPIPGTSETSLTDRLPDDLRNTAADLDFDSLPFAPLYRTDVEFAAELSNQTVHGVMHLAWVDQGEGRYQGQMAVYVKPRGRLGKGYMELIKPFRHWIVYPALMRQIERTWNHAYLSKPLCQFAGGVGEWS